MYLEAISGSIGVGFFVGIGGVLPKAGPLSVFLGYLTWGLFYVWPLDLCVPDMMAYLRVSGSIFELASRYVDPALGFAMSWTYFYAGVMLVCVEYAAIATIMTFWESGVNPAAWIVMTIAVCFILDMVAVQYYGEAEFVMASMKILLLFGLVLLTIITMCGGNPRHDAYGFLHWKNGNAMHSYYWKVCLYAAPTIAKPDMIALTASEIQNPRRTIPRVAKLIFYRLIGFHIVGVLAVGVICSSLDQRLPVRLGLTGLINFFILMPGWSCANAYLYSSSRTLYDLARNGHAPKILLHCIKAGVPVYCVIVVSLLTCLTFLVASNNAAEVFFWFAYLTTINLISMYTMMLIIYLSWWRARKAQGLTNDSLPICVTTFFGFDIFLPFSLQGFITSYFCIPYTPLLYFGWKIVKRTKLVNPKEADLMGGKKEATWKHSLEDMAVWKCRRAKIW
ncbi:amino acid permease/ SLC12A domain-containing protein [Fusarium oxysporum f. sp. albedinis]|nr:amino acid permease/ SLC12A domain-containing protein [Fusarium oxysporum f. sp. albedinis]